ncbi:hypothetical protein CMUS01_15295, partial [Colletotrichum musicola]
MDSKSVFGSPVFQPDNITPLRGSIAAELPAAKSQQPWFHGHASSALLWLLSCLFLLCVASPADIEIDLVFPKANETYKLIWPFPIIYTIRNASQLWQENYEVARFSVS